MMLVAAYPPEPDPEELAVATRALAAGGLRVERSTIAVYTAERLTAEGLEAGRSYTYTAHGTALAVRHVGFLAREPNDFERWAAARRGAKAEHVSEPRYLIARNGRATGPALDAVNAARRFVALTVEARR